MGMRLTFYPRVGGGSSTVAERSDGVVLRMQSYDRKWRVPHDLSHAVTERELRIAAGVFGCIAAGAMFGSMQVERGKLRYDAKQRSKRILDANKRTLGMAEVLVGGIHWAVEQRLATTAAVRNTREHWASLSAEPVPFPDEAIGRAVDILRDLATGWPNVGADSGLEFQWPAKLIAAVPKR